MSEAFSDCGESEQGCRMIYVPRRRKRISEWNNLCCHRVGLDLAGHLAAVG